MKESLMRAWSTEISGLEFGCLRERTVHLWETFFITWDFCKKLPTVALYHGRIMKGVQ
jgi:hypothetical protein